MQFTFFECKLLTGPSLKQSFLTICPPTFCVLHHGLHALEILDVIHPFSEVGLVSVASKIPDVAELQAFDGIVFVFAVLIPAPVAAVSVHNLEHPKSFSSPNIGYSASSSSSVEAVNEESVDNSKCDRANYGSDNAISNMGLRYNKILEFYRNKPNHDHNTLSDTSDLPTDATRNHSRKTGLRLHQEQRKHHWYLVTRLR